jgi:multidrug resistance efflux pump
MINNIISNKSKRKWLLIILTISLAFVFLLTILGLIFFGQTHFFVEADGRLIPTSKVSAAAHISGLINKVYLPEGSIVSLNTPILSIIPGQTQEASELRMRTTQKRLELAITRGNIQNLQQSKQMKTRELVELELRIKRKQNEVSKIIKQLEDLEKMFAKGYASKEEILNQQNILEINTAEMTELEKYKKTLAQRELLRQKRKAKALQEDINQLSQSQQQIIVCPPKPGLLLGLKDWQSLTGQFVYKGEPLFEITEPGKFYFQALIKEQDLLKIKVGQLVIVNLWAIPREILPPIKGQVTYIAPKVQYNKQGVFFPVFCTLNLDSYAKRAYLRAGLNGQARIDTGKKRIVKMIFKSEEFYE